MNPYDFVRIDWEKGVPRRPPDYYHRFGVGLLSGCIEGTIIALTPLFIPQTKDLKLKEQLLQANRPITFARNAAGEHIIPGSSLKGLFRSLLETLGPGCWWLFDGKYRDRIDYTNKLPSNFKQCPRSDGLCIACRLFGLIKGGTLLLGRVGFDDAVCNQPVSHDPIYTRILDTPKPRHKAWYLDPSGKWVAGRKFYFHSDRIHTESAIQRSGRGVILNSYIHPIGPGSTFTFSMHFTNVAPDDWPVLLYALVLEREDWGHAHNVRHKIGYAKPTGLGSIEIQLTRLTLVDYNRRYTAEDRGITVYEDRKLRDYVNGQINKLVKATSITLQDLRRIWCWPPLKGVIYKYPDRDWFRKHPHEPIRKTP
jgi:CRISPR/Cas system CSM-associated protein Csm3 (group 7 of RAMP superfamily)